MAVKVRAKTPKIAATVPNGQPASELVRKEDLYELDLDNETVLVAQMWLPLSDMIIDNRYQHALTESRAARYAANWSPALAGLITVSERKKGHKYAILDGQHRARALQIRGETKVWCEVFFDLSLKQEAFIFWQRNKERVPINSLDAFRSALTAGDPVAGRLQNVLDAVGIFVGDQGANPDAYRAVAALTTLMRWSGDTDHLLTATLKLTRGAWPQEPRAKEKPLLLGVGQLLWNFPGLDHKRLQGAMGKLRLPKLLTDGATLQATLGQREFEHICRLLLRAYNAEERAGRLDETKLHSPSKAGGNVGRGPE